MPVIYKRGKSYYIDYRVQGKRMRKRLGRSKQIAELALKDIEVKLARKELIPAPRKISLDEFFEEYSNHARKSLAPRSFERYREVIHHFCEFLTNYPQVKSMSQVSDSLFEKFQDERIGKIKAITINFEITVLRAIFNYAAKKGFCIKNPTLGVEFLKVTDRKQPIFLTGEEITKILDFCKTDPRFKYLYPIIFTFLHTGLRLGELVHLEQNDIDLGARVIKIQNKGYWHTKSYKPRVIPISDELHQVLSPYISARNKLKAKIDHNFVFIDQAGAQLDKHLRDKFMRLTASCGLKHVTRLHTLRHTFASHLVMNGVDLPSIQKLLGHTDIETTMIYSHLSPEHLIKAVNKLSFSGSPTKA